MSQATYTDDGYFEEEIPTETTFPLALPNDALFNEVGRFFPEGDLLMERVFREKGQVDPSIANAAAFWGVNSLKTIQLTAGPKSGNGYVFFTRPRLNLSNKNIRRDRRFTLLANTQDGSVLNIIRAILDPVSHYNGEFKCSRIDPRTPFIAICSNQLRNLSGWPELVADRYSTRQGIMGETHSMVDGYTANYGDVSINATFQNTIHDGINLLFHFWTLYSLLVRRGVMYPHKDDWLYRRINYNTRIYRFVTDTTSTYITNWSCTGASIPQNTNINATLDFNLNEPINTANKEVSINFPSNGCWVLDPIVLREFNRTVEMFNPEMGLTTRSKSFQKLTMAERPYFVHVSIPYIDLKTARLDWYVNLDLYKSEMNLLGFSK